MKIESEVAEFDALLDVAKKICLAARTAPKACGTDDTNSVILYGEEKAQLAEEMRIMSADWGPRGANTGRDADNIDAAQIVVLLGIKYKTRGLNEICQLCGFENCAACKEAGATCVFVGVDLGIALGSAVAIAADAHADNRIFFTAGKAAMRFGLPEENMLVMGIPLYVGGKSIFYDRPKIG